MTLRISLSLAVRVKSYMPYILEEDITVYSTVTATQKFAAIAPIISC
jgi:hypothetical protein